jgi:hypothetical protein
VALFSGICCSRNGWIPKFQIAEKVGEVVPDGLLIGDVDCPLNGFASSLSDGHLSGAALVMLEDLEPAAWCLIALAAS